MTKNEKRLFMFSCVFALVFGVTQTTFAMHIMEGYLPKTHCVVWGVLCLPFLTAGFIRIKKIVNDHRKTLLLLAMVGAYAFVLSAQALPLTLRERVLAQYYSDQALWRYWA